MPDEPTLGEVMRQVNMLVAQITALTQRMADDRRDYEQVFVRRDVYEARHGSLTRRVDGLEHDAEDKEKSDAGFRRQIIVTVLGALLVAVLSIIVSVMLGSGGPPT